MKPAVLKIEAVLNFLSIPSAPSDPCCGIPIETAHRLGAFIPTPATSELYTTQIVSGPEEDPEKPDSKAMQHKNVDDNFEKKLAGVHWDEEQPQPNDAPPSEQISKEAGQQQHLYHIMLTPDRPALPANMLLAIIWV